MDEVKFRLSKNVWSTKNGVMTTMDEIVQKIKHDEQIKNAVEKYRVTMDDNDKKSLPVVEFYSVCDGDCRNANVKSLTGYCTLDIDENIYEMGGIDKVVELLSTDDVLCPVLVYRSPKGTRLKVVLNVPSIKKIDTKTEGFTEIFREMYRQICNYYSLNYCYRNAEENKVVYPKLDESVADTARRTYLSHDENCYYNPNGVCKLQINVKMTDEQWEEYAKTHDGKGKEYLKDGGEIDASEHRKIADEIIAKLDKDKNGNYIIGNDYKLYIGSRSEGDAKDYFQCGDDYMGYNLKLKLNAVAMLLYGNDVCEANMFLCRHFDGGRGTWNQCTMAHATDKFSLKVLRWVVTALKFKLNAPLPSYNTTMDTELLEERANLMYSTFRLVGGDIEKCKELVGSGAVKYDKDRDGEESTIPSKYAKLRNHIALVDAFWDVKLDDFGGTTYINGIEYDEEANPVQIGKYMESFFGGYNKQLIKDTIVEVAAQNKFNIVTEKIDSLVWDGVNRAETFFIDRIGTFDTPLNRELTFKWLYAMLKRQYEHGCTFDHYLVLWDEQQGTGKTGTLEKLGNELVSNKVLTDTKITANTKANGEGKDNVQKLVDCVIGVFDESNGVNERTYDSVTLEDFKSFITQKNYKTRFAYGKGIKTYKSHCVIAMITNKSDFLQDNRGLFERRAWVLNSHGDTERSEEEWYKLNNTETIRQVWAEMKYYYDHQDEAPFDITGDGCTFLSDERKNELAEVQRDCKSGNSDVEGEEYIRSILEHDYAKKYHRTIDEFKDDFYGYDNACTKQQIDIIPLNYVQIILKEKIKRGRKAEYIATFINELHRDFGWKVVLNGRYYQKLNDLYGIDLGYELRHDKKINYIIRRDAENRVCESTKTDNENDILDGVVEVGYEVNEAVKDENPDWFDDDCEKVLKK